LPLTATEFWLLEFLMSRPGVVYSREHDRAVTDRMVDVYILRLRHKIEADPTNPTFILAVRGFGYSFNEICDGAEKQCGDSHLIRRSLMV
jgi:DNA-binding response OmpR family regulator